MHHTVDYNFQHTKNVTQLLIYLANTYNW